MTTSSIASTGTPARDTARLDGAGAKLGRRRVLQRAEKGAHGRARGADDDDWVTALIVKPPPPCARRHPPEDDPANRARRRPATAGNRLGFAVPSQHRGDGFVLELRQRGRRPARPRSLSTIAARTPSKRSWEWSKRQATRNSLTRQFCRLSERGKRASTAHA